jgi:hypothetical protein
VAAVVRHAIAILAAAVLGGGCKSGDEAKDGDPTVAADATPRADVPEASAQPEPAAGVDPSGPLFWLDPKAGGVAWIDLPASLSPAALTAVFGLPPRASGLLEAPREIDDALATVTGDDEIGTRWFRGGALVTTTRLGAGPYVVRSLAVPRADVAAKLEDASFQSTTTEGFEIWAPRGAFPWRVVMLDETNVAFVPAREPGSGLAPLTAGRDMPPSDMERELSRLLAEDSTVRVSLYTAGPMLHFDVGPSLLGARLELRTFGSGGLDGRVLFQPESDPSAVAEALGKRRVPEETDQIQLLAEEVAYETDGELVIGRLQVPATKIAALEIEP